MKLNNEIQYSKNRLEQLADSQRNLISSREKEINKLGDMYELRKENERYNGEVEILDIRDRNQNEIAEQLNLKEERLNNIKTSFDTSKKKLDLEREILANSHQEKIEDLNAVYDNKYKASFENANQVAEEIDDQTHDIIRRMEDETTERIAQSTFENKIRADEKSLENTRKLANQERVHKTQQRAAVKNYDRRSAELVMEHENQLMNQNYQQLSQRKELENIHNKEIEFKSEQHKNILLQEDKSFRQKYEAITKEHQSVLDRIKQKFSNQINSIINSQMRSKTSVESRGDDDFYKITALEPEITSLEKSYQISLKVPEHEKENVRLTAQGRDLTLSLTRKFSDTVESEDGSSNQSSRSEVFTKKLSTTDLMNSREITQNYKEGVLTFNIAKL
ncbi:hypothetical protein BIY24_09145 [Halobacteriovorax marinus]|uniref:Hsp20/alpha crystallin family protein n=1 Tax=Halobacteriovorax marinus TaxID=97084 RepID=UPI000BC2DA31|nr:Hsp20/alpha crystallin family protein [Halobacteriovorax marinus]ATH08108.1 hypothetical protein BIY24_09145 [Halobacteriovorax marinus]